jgi:hypothetical protein
MPAQRPGWKWAALVGEGPQGLKANGRKRAGRGEVWESRFGTGGAEPGWLADQISRELAREGYGWRMQRQDKIGRGQRREVRQGKDNREHMPQPLGVL